eukprot:2549287-Prymnesium_polylepis.1
MAPCPLRRVGHRLRDGLVRVAEGALEEGEDDGQLLARLELRAEGAEGERDALPCEEGGRAILGRVVVPF